MDVAIINGRVIDGTGRKSFKADVRIVGDTIARIDACSNTKAAHVIDAEGKTVCPGFIDPHTHCCDGNNPAFLRQGVTTVIDGNCGFCAPMSERRNTFAKGGKLTNYGNLVGLNTARDKAMGGSFDRAPTASELAVMKTFVVENMKAGAFGVSTGLEYVPGCYMKTEEIIELASTAAPFGGYYTSHIRNESGKLVDAVQEAIRVGKESSLPVHLSHFKVCGIPNIGRSQEALEMLDAAITEGMNVTFDQYPYSASNGSLRLMFPPWALEGSDKEMTERLEDPEPRARIMTHLTDRLRVFYGGQPERLIISRCVKEPELAGLDVREISRRKGHADDIEGAAETLLELFRRDCSHMGNFVIFHCMDEGDIERIMRHAAGAIGSDAWTVPFGKDMPHPRHYGPFPRVLGRYCRDRKLFSLEEAVRKMTSLPASIVGLRKRGVLEEGCYADIVVFDPETVVDHATFDQPHQYPTGIHHVIVNGTVVLENGKVTGEEGGRFLARA